MSWYLSLTGECYNLRVHRYAKGTLWCKRPCTPSPITQGLSDFLKRNRKRAKPASSLSFFLPSSLGYYRRLEGNLSATPYRVLTNPHPLLALSSRTFFIQTLLAPYRILEYREIWWLVPSQQDSQVWKPSKSLWKSGYTFCLISPSSRELPTSQGACCFLSFVPPASFPLFLPFFLSLF